LEFLQLKDYNITKICRINVKIITKLLNLKKKNKKKKFKKKIYHVDWREGRLIDPRGWIENKDILRSEKSS